MKLTNRIAALAALGKLVRSFSEDEKEQLYSRAAARNSWFTREYVLLALESISRTLREAKLRHWAERCALPEENTSPKKTGVVMAGNVPLAGFPDFLAVLVSGHMLYAKLSPQDPVLLPFMAEELCEIEPAFRNKIHFADRLKGMDAMIVSSSDNSSRYLEQYFSKLPHIIRKTRSSCAVLDGTESAEEIFLLGLDITRNFGLGAGNVSKLYVPEGYNFSPLLDALEPYNSLKNHHRYVNNYDYNKSVYLVNRVPHLDNGFLMLKEDAALLSPISVVHYEYYANEEDLQEKLKAQEGEINYVVGHSAGQISFGKAHEPELWDYAGGKDTLEFLKQL